VELHITSTGIFIKPLDEDAPESDWQQQEMSLIMFAMGLSRGFSENRNKGRAVRHGFSKLRNKKSYDENGNRIYHLAFAQVPWWIKKEDIITEQVGTGRDKRYRKKWY